MHRTNTMVSAANAEAHPQCSDGEIPGFTLNSNLLPRASGGRNTAHQMETAGRQLDRHKRRRHAFRCIECRVLQAVGRRHDGIHNISAVDQTILETASVEQASIHHELHNNVIGRFAAQLVGNEHVLCLPQRKHNRIPVRESLKHVA